MMLALRVIHIGAGVFWAGTVVFLSFYLMPAVGRAGPDGGRVMQELQKGRLMQVLPAAALATILSGAWLMWTQSAGFHPRFFGSGYGIALTIGAVASIVGFLIGFTVMRPAQLRMAALAPGMATAAEDERARIGAEVGTLRTRSARAARSVAWLLIVAVVTMAAARHV